MHKSQSLFYLTTVLHVSGVTITHFQEHKTTVTAASGNRYTVLLSAVIVEELYKCVRIVNRATEITIKIYLKFWKTFFINTLLIIHKTAHGHMITYGC